ncbi:hypothetical protein PSHT_13393 [Puccinia striiformis]|uniref:Uncharacterized protein n=1 Tax=Puccinia striiformis TaxID=27350 RepID=A0A2S4UR87_9BASI|nr:hypothetical protein PSHT_13393 [Puccinia striiformis]
MAALTPGDDWYNLMNKLAESADLPPSDHGEISESDGMGTHSTQSDVNWIQEMRLMDPDPHEGMSDHLTQASLVQETQEARYVQSAQMPIQVPHTSYPVPPHSPAYDSRPGSLNSVVINTPINTMKASSVVKYVTPGIEDRQRKRLRDWQSRLTRLEGQDLHPEPSHFERGILEFDHPRASQMNQMGSLYATRDIRCREMKADNTGWHGIASFQQSIRDKSSTMKSSTTLNIPQQIFGHIP